jgi:FkbM family methyltransferase
LRSALRRIGPVRRLAERGDPRLDADYVWTLEGPLAGLRMRVLPGPQQQYVRAPYEPEVCAAIKRLVRPGDSCADVGANIGYMTLLIASQCGPSGHVKAFEPLPENIALLLGNVALNQFSNRVEVINAAVSDGKLSQVFLYEGNSTFEFSLLPREGHEGGVEVPAVTLDQEFPSGMRLDFVKFDIEGAESAALVGMRRVLAEQRPICLLEIMPENASAIADELGRADYVFTTLDDVRCDPPFQRRLTPHVIARPRLSVAKGSDERSGATRRSRPD